MPEDPEEEENCETCEHRNTCPAAQEGALVIHVQQLVIGGRKIFASSPNPVVLYNHERLECQTLDELKAVTKKYESIAGDACDIVHAWTEEEFQAYKEVSDLQLDSAGTKQFIMENPTLAQKLRPVFSPSVGSNIFIAAEEYGLPWTAVFQRLIDTGTLVLDDKERWVFRKQTTKTLDSGGRTDYYSRVLLTKAHKKNSSVPQIPPSIM